MSGRVIFALTETQAAALVAIELGAAVRAQSPAARDQLLKALQGKGLVSIATENGVIALTELGDTAVALCARLALGKVNGRATR